MACRCVACPDRCRVCARSAQHAVRLGIVPSRRQILAGPAAGTRGASRQRRVRAHFAVPTSIAPRLRRVLAHLAREAHALRRCAPRCQHLARHTCSALPGSSQRLVLANCTCRACLAVRAQVPCIAQARRGGSASGFRDRVRRTVCAFACTLTGVGSRPTAVARGASRLHRVRACLTSVASRIPRLRRVLAHLAREAHALRRRAPRCQHLARHTCSALPGSSTRLVLANCTCRARLAVRARVSCIAQACRGRSASGFRDRVRRTVRAFACTLTGVGSRITAVASSAPRLRRELARLARVTRAGPAGWLVHAGRARRATTAD